LDEIVEFLPDPFEIFLVFDEMSYGCLCGDLGCACSSSQEIDNLIDYEVLGEDFWLFHEHGY
jgi:hypothetical protein